MRSVSFTQVILVIAHNNQLVKSLKIILNCSLFLFPINISPELSNLIKKRTPLIINHMMLYLNEVYYDTRYRKSRMGNFLKR